MLFSYNWLKDYIKGELPIPKRLAELLSGHSFEVEKIEKRNEDWVMDIDVLPNRACDCLSHIGVARESAIVSGQKFCLPLCPIKKNKEERVKNEIKLKVEDKNDCPRYTGRVISNIKVKDSPFWIQKRLKSCGLQPINSIVDITNYVMLETGQPLHAFDLDKMGQEIIVRRARKGEEIKALGGEVYKLDEDILVIADEKEPLAIAGIKGGEKAEIDSQTKRILIEAANFNPKLIRRTSKKIKLKTDASWRFENGIDPNLADWTQERVSSLVQGISGGDVSRKTIDFYPKKTTERKIKLNLNYVEKLLGRKVLGKEIKNALEKLGFEVKGKLSEEIEIKVPTRRLDVSLQEDLIEEIGRILDYQNIIPSYPYSPLFSPSKNKEIFWQKICQDILKELGFFEVYNYSFIGEKEKEVFELDEKKLVELENPISSLNRYLRPNLLIKLVKNVEENLKNFEEIKIFELGDVFEKRQLKNKKEEIKERKMLSGLIARKKTNSEDFYELKGVVDFLLNKLAISNILYDDFQSTSEFSSPNFWNIQKCAEIKAGKEGIGFLGEINSAILKKIDIKEKIFLFNLNFEKISKIASEEQEYNPISPYPPAVRDLAILVSHNTKIVDILDKINNIGKGLVKDVELFDIYEGKEIPKGKKNLAFHIIYQSGKKTLTSEEVDNIHQRIVNELEKKADWKVRGVDK